MHFSWVEHGIHAIRFFVEGRWLTVVVDDLIPVDMGGHPVFGRCRQAHHIWVQVLCDLGGFFPYAIVLATKGSFSAVGLRMTSRCRCLRRPMPSWRAVMRQLNSGLRMMAL